ncbi:laccase-2-like [Venturia canescens]|uniref:laccase-2-like n=1 Tax=Venturia canescens TaxID=32260 RepID=UPI001C9C52FD|nr:laccase-2-like [Venturia canescens]
MKVSDIVLIFGLYLFVRVAESFESFRFKTLAKYNGNPELVGGSSHPCYRECKAGENLTCNYSFTLTQYTSMSYACRDCPFNENDCFRDGCVSAGGYVRPITVANKMMPGPSIQVCKNDRIRVKIVNAFTSESATIHWHGIHQVGTPYMDGTPFVTQCPIPPHNTFTYDFVASPAGTHIWHSHIGFEESDGLYGSLIVRKANDPLSKYYDYDLAEHVMIVWHWYDSSTAFRLATALHRNTKVSGYGLLINGLASGAEIKYNDTIYKTPRKVFEVDPGRRYRFRVIFNSAVYCPVQISIDDHKLLMIASETGTFTPLLVDSFIINSGERYDFVLHTGEKPANYWIRYRGLGDCQTDSVQVSELAVLRYRNSIVAEPQGGTGYHDAMRSGVLLNPVQVDRYDYTNNTIFKVSDLSNTGSPRGQDVSGTPNHTFYFAFSFNQYDSYFAPGPYPQINNLSFEYPPLPLLTEHEYLTSDMYCTESDDSNKDCVYEFCSCPIIYRVKKDSLVEIVFVDTSTIRNQDHPMHLHGHDYRVVSMETVGSNCSLEMVKRANEAGMISKRLEGGPIKDTVGVPASGFTIVRFIATNPGYWFFHCHIANHVEMGMGFVLQVGDSREMIKPPPDFPRCGRNDCSL